MELQVYFLLNTYVFSIFTQESFQCIPLRLHYTAFWQYYHYTQTYHNSRYW